MKSHYVMLQSHCDNPTITLQISLLIDNRISRQIHGCLHLINVIRAFCITEGASSEIEPTARKPSSKNKAYLLHATPSFQEQASGSGQFSPTAIFYTSNVRKIPGHNYITVYRIQKNVQLTVFNTTHIINQTASRRIPWLTRLHPVCVDQHFQLRR